MTIINVKHGTTFRHAIPISLDADGWAGVTVTAQACRGNFRVDLSVRKSDDRPGHIEISSPTDDWPCAMLALDARATRDDSTEVWATPTIYLSIIPEVTRD